MEYKHLIYCPFTGLGLYGGFRGNRWLQNRIQIFKQFVIPSLKAQTNKDFTLWISWRPEEKNNPDIEFHLYGNTKEWPTKNKNIIVHGKVPKGQMNREIKTMQGALRLLPFEGFSEIIAKSILWGQWPISEIEYPHMLKVSEIAKLKSMKEPNIKGRKYYNIKLNKYPWNTNI